MGIPTVIDRIIQQAIAQQLVPIYEPLFSDDSYGYRPNRSAQQAIQKVKQYAEEGYTSAVLVDLSKYFDTLNHELLMNLLRKNIHDKRVIELIKRYLKAGGLDGLLAQSTGCCGGYETRKRLFDCSRNSNFFDTLSCHDSDTLPSLIFMEKLSVLQKGRKSPESLEKSMLSGLRGERQRVASERPAAIRRQFPSG